MTERRKKIPSNDILKEVAKLTEKELYEDMQIYMEAANCLNDEEVPADEKFLEFACRYDREGAAKGKHRIVVRIGRIAAMFLICTMALGVITMGVSEAFRLKVFNLFYHDDVGGIGLVPEESDGENIDSDKLYCWYPQYLPGGFELSWIQENGLDIEMLFKNFDMNCSIRIIESKTNGASMTYDTEFLVRKEVSIGDSKGYIFIDEEYDSCIIVWQVGNNFIEVITERYVDQNELLKMAESMERWENNL